MISVEAHRSIRQIPQGDWDACFPGDPEGWSYYVAIEEAGLPAFSWVYFAAREAGRVVAVVPAFITDYHLATTVQGAARTALAPLLWAFGSLLTLRLLSLGSPHADKCHLGFAPGVSPENRQEIAGRLLAQLDRFATGQGIGLLAAKDVADDDLAPGVGEALAAAGFMRQPSLPNTLLELRGDEGAYLNALSSAARRDVRRKLKGASPVRVEERRGRAALGLVPQIVALYEAQRSRSGVDFDQFETLTPAYFRGVLEQLGDATVVFVYLHDNEPIAFNLCYHSGRRFIDKFIGLSLPLARTLNVYVLSWMTNVRYCIARGIPAFQTGQTGYAMKLHLGSSLQANWIYFRHRNPVVNFVLRLAGPLLAADRHDEELAGATRRAP
jgi:hypothetical protein